MEMRFPESPRQRNKAVMHELTVGQKVICKHKNGRYYQCDVVQLSKETFYEVNFDDGSFSDNLFPEDIVVGFTALSLSCHLQESPKTKHSKNVESETYDGILQPQKDHLYNSYTQCVSLSL